MASDRPGPTGTRRATRFTGKALAAPLSTESHCAAVTLQLSTLAWILDPPQSGPSSQSPLAWILCPHLLRFFRAPRLPTTPSGHAFRRAIRIAERLSSGPSSSAPAHLLLPSGQPPQTRNGNCPHNAERRQVTTWRLLTKKFFQQETAPSGPRVTHELCFRVSSQARLRHFA